MKWVDKTNGLHKAGLLISAKETTKREEEVLAL